MFTGMLSRPPISNITTLETHMNIEHFTHDTYKEAYTEEDNFKKSVSTVTRPNSCRRR
jgi:hypothetical protein